MQYQECKIYISKEIKQFATYYYKAKELSLETFKVLQSRGACNQNTEYHDRIIKLVNKNVSLIRKRMVA